MSSRIIVGPSVRQWEELDFPINHYYRARAVGAAGHNPGQDAIGALLYSHRLGPVFCHGDNWKAGEERQIHAKGTRPSGWDS